MTGLSPHTCSLLQLCLNTNVPEHETDVDGLSLHGVSRSVNRQRWRACVSDRAVKWLYKHDKLFPNIITSAECISISSRYTHTQFKITAPSIFDFIWLFIIRVI